MFRLSVWHPLARSGPGQTAFRRDDKPFWIRIKRLGYEQFACIRPVCVSSIYQVHTKFDDPSENFERVLSIRGQPQMPCPVTLIAPKPRRLTVRSPPNVKVVLIAIFDVFDVSAPKITSDFPAKSVAPPTKLI